MDTKKYNVALFDCFSFQYFKMGKSKKIVSTFDMDMSRALS